MDWTVIVTIRVLIVPNHWRLALGCLWRLVSYKPGSCGDTGLISLILTGAECAKSSKEQRKTLQGEALGDNPALRFLSYIKFEPNHQVLSEWATSDDLVCRAVALSHTQSHCACHHLSGWYHVELCRAHLKHGRRPEVLGAAQLTVLLNRLVSFLTHNKYLENYSSYSFYLNIHHTWPLSLHSNF